MAGEADQRLAEQATAGADQVAPDEIKEDVAAVVGAVPGWMKKEVVAAAVHAAPGQIKTKVAASAVKAVPDEIKTDAAAAAVHAAPDEIKQDVAVAAVGAVSGQMREVVTAAVEDALAAPRESEDSRIEKAVAKALRAELSGPPLVNYKGSVGIDVVDENGHSLRIDKTGQIVGMRPGANYVLQLAIGPDPKARLTLPLRISSGIDEERVEFDVMLDSDDPRLRPAKQQTVTLDTAGGSARTSFPLHGQWEVPTRLWLRVAQRGQFIQNVELTLASPEAE